MLLVVMIIMLLLVMMMMMILMMILMVIRIVMIMVNLVGGGGVNMCVPLSAVFCPSTSAQSSLILDLMMGLLQLPTLTSVQCSTLTE